MKLCIYLIVLLNPFLNVDFKRDIWTYPKVILVADLIVDGKISKVSKNQYEFTITQFVKGKSIPKINVIIFEDWTCDRRIEKPKIGQKLILFLKKNKVHNYEIVNQSTGELFIQKDNSVNTFMREKLSDAAVLKTGVKMFLETYTLKGHEFYYSKKKSSSVISTMKKENKFFKFLVDEELKYYTVR